MMQSLIGVRRVVAIGVVLVGIVAPAAAGSGDAANETIFVGHAHDRKTDALLFKEVHTEVTRDDGSVVLEVRAVDMFGQVLRARRLLRIE